jgi:hypothetical protein
MIVSVSFTRDLPPQTLRVCREGKLLSTFRMMLGAADGG